MHTIRRGEFLVWVLQHGGGGGGGVELYLMVLSDYIQLPGHFLA